MKVEIGKKQFVTPTYFPAVSKKEIRDNDDKFMELVCASGYPRLLVSAYDYGKIRTTTQRRIIGKLSDYYRRGSIIMLDSGVFESYWREDSRWAFRNYRESVRNIDSDFFFSFDVLPLGGMSKSKFHRQTTESISESIKLQNGSHCIPIVHGNNPHQLVGFVSDLVRRIPQLLTSLAVSERELGHSISDRCATIMKLHEALSKRGRGLLHILGCGHPISMALYVYCGADMFDSLDWAISAFDPVVERLIDISHFEFLRCKCEVCRKSNIDPSSRVYLHNLLSYQKYCMKLQTMIKQGTLRDYLQEVVGKRFLSKLA